MAATAIHRIFAPLKAHLPRWISNPLRSLGTAVLTPLFFSYRTGHFLSSFKMAAVTKEGKPLPWYTYPCIDFLAQRSFEDKTVLEFGGGQSTLWWAQRAKQVVTLEEDGEWFQRLKSAIPRNVDLHRVSGRTESDCLADVRRILGSNGNPAFDVIVIDGLYRQALIDTALGLISDRGMIVCDDSDGYGIYEGFSESGLNRVDFCGNTPGVFLPHATSVYFGPACFAFDAKVAISATAY